ncbi:MerR family transcriptional regulator [Microbacterium sp. NPDC091676]|uniref:MerR family transcriptional regulator n=1 Tax=Microbacterium sp. NPDC091676 TaxID=3364212 RepID=UPI00382F44E9
MSERDWSIQEIARLAGTTSRTLRHYDDIGLLPPSRIAANGYRHYDAAALVRLQRILLLRELGLGLPQIGEVLGPSTGSGTQGGGSGTRAAEASALETHLALLREEQTRLARQIASVESTITALRGGENLMAENMFDGFDHTQYKQEVEDRWGKKAYADGDRWWRGMTDAERAEWQQRVSDLGRDWIAAAESGIDPASAEAQELARRHVAWLTGIPGTPAAALRQGPDPVAQAYVIGLGEMYVADPRFGANYATSAGGTHGAEFVRDALRIYAEASL